MTTCAMTSRSRSSVDQMPCSSNARSAPISPRACAVPAGYTELYVDAPGALYAAYLQADSGQAVSAMEELERTREALADSQIRLGELEEKLAFVEQLLERDQPRKALPKGP